jgi:glycosyltransferase involved in cell wall biosynthesis
MKTFKFRIGKSKKIIPSRVQSIFYKSAVTYLKVKKKSYIFDIGQDNLNNKAYILHKNHEIYNLSTVYFAYDRYGLSKDNQKHNNLNVTYLCNKSIIDYFNLIMAFIKYKPLHVEFFLGIRSWDLLVFILISKFFRKRIYIKCRGGEILNWEKHSFQRKLVNKFALRTANLISIRELYMPEYFIKYNIASLNKVYFLHNTTLLPIKGKKIRKSKKMRLLFLNSLKNFRNPLHLIQISEKLREYGIPFVLNVVGLTQGNLKSYEVHNIEQEFLLQIKEKNLSNFIFTHKFTNYTEKFFTNSDIFLLTSDLVFCNNSLIEAMAYKCVPVVYESFGSHLIIENKKSGFITEPKPSNVAKIIKDLYFDNNKLNKISINSKRKIQRDFNLLNQSNDVLGLYKRHLWK